MYLFMNKLVICFEISPHFNNDDRNIYSILRSNYFRVSYDELVNKMINMRLCEN